MIDATWFTACVVWLIFAARTKRTTRKQSSASRMLQALLVTAGFVLIFRREMHWMGQRLYPPSEAAAYTGISMTVFGVAFAIWARLFLGRNWSATVTIKQDHEIVRSGPYAVVRHPIYSGFLLAFLGTAIYVGELRAFLGVSLTFAGWWLKLKMEESFMLSQFGSQYRDYQREVKALIPFVL